MAWDDTTVRYTIRDARLVAVIADGGAYVHSGDLLFEEGRLATGYGDDPGNPPMLEWHSNITVVDGRLPECSVSVEARIIVDGTHADGRIEIRGDGWIGFNEHGDVEASFRRPPAVIVDDVGEPIRGDVSTDEPTREADTYLRNLEPKMPPEFERALRSRGEIEESPY